MNPNEKLTQLLTNKFFQHEGGDYAFMSCKTVGSNLMVLTNKKTIQIPVDRFVDFYQKVEANCYNPADIINKDLVPTNVPEKTAEVKKAFVPEIPMKNQVMIVPESPKVFSKLNQRFENLIDAIDSASEEDLNKLEAKAKMLASIGQTAINMENSRNGLIKMLSGK